MKKHLERDNYSTSREALDTLECLATSTFSEVSLEISMTNAPLKKPKESKWREKARYLDIVRGTRLGTLGYLPPEIRHQIWRKFFVFEYYLRGFYYLEPFEQQNQIQFAQDLPREPQIFWNQETRWKEFDVPHFNSSAYFISTVHKSPFVSDIGSAFQRRWFLSRSAWWQAQRPQLAPKTIRKEMEAVFFLTHQFTIKTPLDLRHFCRLIPLHCHGCLRHISIWLMGACWSRHRDTAISIRGFETVIESWRESVEFLPASVRTVLVRLDGKNSTKELDALRVIVEAIKQRAKEAVITICRNGDDGELTDKKMAAYQEVVNSPIILYSRDTGIDGYGTD